MRRDPETGRVVAVPIGDRFWPKVDKSDELGGCWIWRGDRDSRNYGRIRDFRKGHERSIGAHRVAYQLTHGQIPDRLVVCHRCDNPPCVNPAHLFLGTMKDNQSDMARKGRSARGERQGGAKLSEQDIPRIRELYAAGSTQREVAQAFGVSQGTISLIVKGAVWGHVDGLKPVARRWPRGETSGMSKTTSDDVRKMRAAYAAGGISQDALAKQYGLTQVAVSSIIRRKTWAHVQ